MSIISERNKRRRSRKIQMVYNYKREHHCISCGERDTAKLEFHHKDPTKKLFGLGTITVMNKSYEHIKQEIDKCDILCHECHSKLHRLNPHLTQKGNDSLLYACRTIAYQRSTVTTLPELEYITNA